MFQSVQHFQERQYGFITQRRNGCKSTLTQQIRRDVHRAGWMSALLALAPGLVALYETAGNTPARSISASMRQVLLSLVWSVPHPALHVASHLYSPVRPVSSNSVSLAALKLVAGTTGRSNANLKAIRVFGCSRVYVH